MIHAVVYLAMATGIACGLALWLLPSRLFVAKGKAAPDDAAPPPWRSLNRPGRIVYTIFVSSAALLVLALAAGALLEA